jgi:molybdopterin-guanine dinucleotide biosynthesis protein A
VNNTFKKIKYSAIILAGGSSKRFGEDKGLAKLLGKPMILHVYDKIEPLVDEVIIVVSSETQFSKYKNLSSHARVIIDEGSLQGPLIGALAGFRNATGDYSILLSCDTPMLSGKVASLLIELALGHDAVIPQWPNNYIEPLQAVYNTRTAYASAREAVENRSFRLFDMIKSLNKILYISTLVLSTLDSNLNTFLNVNNQSDMITAEEILKSQNIKLF